MYWIWMILILGVSFYLRYRKANPKQIAYTQVIKIRDADQTDENASHQIIGGNLLDLPLGIVRGILETREEESLLVTFLIHYTNGSTKKTTISNQSPMFRTYLESMRQKGE